MNLRLSKRETHFWKKNEDTGLENETIKKTGSETPNFFVFL